MPRSTGKKKARAPKKRAGAPRKKAGASRRKKREDVSVSTPLDPLRAGMPALDSITGVKEYKAGGKVYRIIQTDEVDEYEKPAQPNRKRSRRR